MQETNNPTHAPGGVLWLTGLSGAGKTTLATALKQRLANEGCLAVVLDGDVLRTGLNAGLGFSPADRQENVRRTAEVAALFMAEGFVAICALISPAATQRQLARHCRRALLRSTCKQRSQRMRTARSQGPIRQSA